MKIGNIVDIIGNTPSVEVTSLQNATSKVFIKVEGGNPGGSVKDRAVLGMINDAVEMGSIKKGSKLIEPTSGNTGIALAMIGKSMGYDVTIVMPETFSVERRNIIKAYGAELVLTEGSKGMRGAIEKATSLVEETPGAVMLNQFGNPGNWKIHYRTTAEEIIADFGEVDYFVAGVGTGGTLTGVGKRLKEAFPNVKIVAVEPQSSPILSGGNPGPHKIQGIGAGFVPEILDRTIIDEVITVADEDAIEATRRLMSDHGLFAGISTGANYFAASLIAERDGNKRVVTLSPDGGMKYLSLNIY